MTFDQLLLLICFFQVCYWWCPLALPWESWWVAFYYALSRCLRKGMNSVQSPHMSMFWDYWH